MAKIASVQNINWMPRDISRWFRKVGIDFQPYDLRHGCAIRAHLQGIPSRLKYLQSRIICNYFNLFLILWVSVKLQEIS
ncbi:hypothetical protein FJR05_05285 [Dolichospermum sp. UHCC 0259]|nr:hypothetical protein [Dolichospermum sp. UHCC 0259]